MKILCVCERGNNRSVCLARILKDYYGHDAIAMGSETNGYEVRQFLINWAEIIILLDERIEVSGMAVSNIIKKIKRWDVGPDIWGNHFHPELERKLISYIRRDKPMDWGKE